MNAAHCCTFLRILVSPLFFFVYVGHDALGISAKTLPFLLLLLLAILELSDALDGYIARRYNQVTDFGKIFDPMADSISRISVFLTFTVEPVHLPLAFVFAFLYRDSIVSTLRTVCAFRGLALAARPSGKLKAVIQAVAAFTISLLMIPHAFGELSSSSLQSISYYIAAIAVAHSLVSGIDYIWANRPYVAQLLSNSSIEKKN